jgi:hypothetical protein
MTILCRIPIDRVSHLLLGSRCHADDVDSITMDLDRSDRSKALDRKDYKSLLDSYIDSTRLKPPCSSYS